MTPNGGPMDTSQFQGQGMQGNQPAGTPPGSMGQAPTMPPNPQMSQPPQDEQHPGQSEQPNEDDSQENLIDFALSEANLAKKLKKKKSKNGTLVLDDIGMQVYKNYSEDERSRQDWLENNEAWLKMALLIRENKTFPWPKASNVKYPLLATAAMQFSARAYPALVPADGRIVKAKVIPYDPDGSMGEKAERIAKHMSYQIMNCIPDWEEEMDKLLMTVAISGVCFKKTYHDSVLGYHVSKIVYPENFCVNYWAKTVEDAYRKTEILFYNENEVEEKIRNNEEFLDIDLLNPPPTVLNDEKKRPLIIDSTPSAPDKSSPHVFLAQHTWWDLDDDGYEEPYIFVIHKDTQKVVRIIARWDKDGVHRDGKGKIIKICPVEYFTAFPFIPNPDGSIYSIGFGVLLGPLNESVNTIINQLIDSGTLSNLQAGFIGKGLRLKMGMSTFQPGEWKAVNATGSDLKDSIFPLPTREPSSVLLNLQQQLITAGNQLASIAEIFVGKMPGQNTPATTTQETVQQGMAVFTAVYKRIYRALQEEFQKLHRLNRIAPGILQEESKALNMPLTASDYDDSGLIIPGADPSGDSQTTKMSKISQVGSMLQLGTIDPMAFTEWSLQSSEVPNYQKLLKQPEPPPPDPKVQAMQQKAQLDQQKAQQDSMAKQQDMQMKERLAMLEMELKKMEIAFEQTRQAMELQGKQAEMKMNQVEQVNQMQMDAVKQSHEIALSKAQGENALANAQQVHQQKMQHGDMAFKQKQKQQKSNGATRKE